MSKRVVQQKFGDAAANYAASSVHASGEDLQWLAQDLTGTEAVLDVGTGAGYAAFAVAPHVVSVECVDMTQQMLEQAAAGAAERGYNNVSFTLADVEDLPHEDETFDVVTSRYCAHHFYNIRKSVAEISRVLKPGGTFLLIDSTVPNHARHDTFINTLEMLRDTGHVRNYSIAEWLDYLERVGMYGMVQREWMLWLDGESWVKRINTPSVYVEAIQSLLAEADEMLIDTFSIQQGDGWGFNLPVVFIKAVKMAIDD
jgi:ubiquinone/menaquinone biosynthesis C-methylase UbiE